jgi:hypothetical protein
MPPDGTPGQPGSGRSALSLLLYGAGTFVEDRVTEGTAHGFTIGESPAWVTLHGPWCTTPIGGTTVPFCTSTAIVSERAIASASAATALILARRTARGESVASCDSRVGQASSMHMQIPSSDVPIGTGPNIG